MEITEYNNLIADFEERVNSGELAFAKLLGDALYQGPSGKEKNTAKAFPYWHLAAQNGDESVYAKVGLIFLQGIDGVEKNVMEGIEFLTYAADNGDVYSQYVLGVTYSEGTDIRKDYEKAVHYYKKAALQNDTEAQYNLGLLCFELNHPSCFHWICCAHLNGHNKSTKFLEGMIKCGSDPASSKEIIQEEISAIKQYGLKCNMFENVPIKSSSKSEGCYIATAVYGSYDAPEVRILRNYRDEYLSNSLLGRAFIKIYYIISPPLARKLKKLGRVNRFVRRILDRFVENIKAEYSQID